MLRLSTIWFLLGVAFVATPLSAAPLELPPELPTASIDFDTDVIAALTRLGCNAGACHGSAKGQGGFKLSLWGGDATSDYDAIVRQMQGRRINLHKSEQSLLLLKPSEQVEHEGGYRLRRGSQAEALLLDWIKQGASRRHLRQLSSLAVCAAPVSVADSATQAKQRNNEAENQDAENATGHSVVVLAARGEKVKLHAAAEFDDGTSRDVTAWATFTADDSAAVSIGKDAIATVKRRGQHTITARYLNRVVAVQVIVPLGQTPVELTSVPRVNFIDDEVLATLANMRLPVSQTATDASFLRRLSIDLTGKLPTPDRVRSFLADTRPNRRALLIDELLASDAFVDYWTFKFAQLFRLNSKALQQQGAKAFHGWLREQIKANVGLDDIAQALLTGEGDSFENGPANFARIAGDPLLQAEFVSETLMGVRLRCANCHDHPLDHWTQDDYHGLAAIFARVQRGRHVATGDRGQVTHPKTGNPAISRLPGTRMLTQKDGDARHTLSTWMTHRDNPYFAKAFANRLWQHMLGRGLVEPVNDLRATNPATHPALLQKLTDHFTRNNYSIRATLRLIANSATYQRSHDPVEANAVDDRFYSRAYVRSLEPEVLADAIADATGSPMRFPGFDEGTRAVQLFDSLVPSATLDILGRCDRTASCELESSAGAGDGAGIDRQLHMINGQLINSRLRASSARLPKLLASKQSDQHLIEELYLSTLTRLPTAKERAFWLEQLRSTDAKERQATAEDLLWALLSCREFVTNH